MLRPITPASKLYNAVERVMIYLYQRWQDECQYEDLRDYLKPLAPYIKRVKATDARMSAKPFGFTCRIGGRAYRFSINSREYSYREIV